MVDEAVNNPEFLPGKHVQYRVKEIKRYIITRFERDVSAGREVGSGCEQLGEYPNWDTAFAVGYALCKAEHERLEYGPGDMRIQYPVNVPNGTEMSLDPAFHSEEEIASIGKTFVNAEGEVEAR